MIFRNKPWLSPQHLSKESIARFAERLREFVKQEIQTSATENNIPDDMAEGAVMGAMVGHAVEVVGLQFVLNVADAVQKALIEAAQDSRKGRPLS